MQLKHLLTVLLAPLVLAYTTVPQVNADIIDLDAAVKQLITSTKAYNGGLLAAQGVDFLIVQGRLTKGNIDVTALPPQTLSPSDTQSIVDTVASTLAIDNPRAVDTLKSKKSLIAQTPGQTTVVQLGLRSLLAGHLEFSDQVLKRTPEAQMAEVQYYVDVISNALQDGVNAFSS